MMIFLKCQMNPEPCKVIESHHLTHQRMQSLSWLPCCSQVCKASHWVLCTLWRPGAEEQHIWRHWEKCDFSTQDYQKGGFLSAPGLGGSSHSSGAWLSMAVHWQEGSSWHYFPQIFLSEPGGCPKFGFDQEGRWWASEGLRPPRNVNT